EPKLTKALSSVPDHARAHLYLGIIKREWRALRFLVSKHEKVSGDSIPARDAPECRRRGQAHRDNGLMRTSYQSPRRSHGRCCLNGRTRRSRFSPQIFRRYSSGFLSDSLLAGRRSNERLAWSLSATRLGPRTAAVIIAGSSPITAFQRAGRHLRAWDWTPNTRQYASFWPLMTAI